MNILKKAARSKEKPDSESRLLTADGTLPESGILRSVNCFVIRII